MASVIGALLLVLMALAYLLRHNWKGIGSLFVLTNTYIIYTLGSTYLAIINLVLCTSLLLLSDREPKRWKHPIKRYKSVVYFMTCIVLLGIWVPYLTFSEISEFNKLIDSQFFNKLFIKHQNIGIVFIVLYIFVLTRIKFGGERKC